MNIGDWVIAEVGDSRTFGYVASINHHQGTFQLVKISRKQKNKEIECMKGSAPGTYGISQAEPVAMYIDLHDINAMIDMALDTNDEEWFKQLTGQEVLLDEQTSNV